MSPLRSASPLVFALIAACATPPPASPAATRETSASPAPLPPSPPPAPAPRPADPPPQSSSSPVAAPPEPPALAVRYHREVEAPVTFVALEHAPFAAALAADAVWMHDARGWHAERLPSAARAAPGLHLSLFYGRDDRVRVIGTHTGDGAPHGVYLRWLPSGFRAAPGEMGKLASLKGTQVAVLGPDDPEIVCQPAADCLVKRRTGWTFLDAPASLTQVAISEGAGWAVSGQELLRLDGKRWDGARAKGSWSTADALFVIRERAWVVETAAGKVHAFDGNAWHTTPSPIDHPRAVWGARPDALWLAGDGGLAFFDGTSWRKAADAPGPLAAVLGRDAGDVWVGGEKGLYRIEPLPNR